MLALPLAVTLATATPAVADDPYPVPDTATITVVGDGSGHGKGLSQYGAYGAAREGLKVDEILDFYYPGTERDSAGGKVRVLVSADDDRDLVIEDRAGLTVRNLASGRTWKLREKKADPVAGQAQRRGRPGRRLPPTRPGTRCA